MYVITRSTDVIRVSTSKKKKRKMHFYLSVHVFRDCAIIIRRGAEKLEGGGGGPHIKLLPR